MSKETALGMIRAGKTGSDILAILEIITQELQSDDIEPTSEEIVF
jgi:hypothetical protein